MIWSKNHRDSAHMLLVLCIFVSLVPGIEMGGLLSVLVEYIHRPS